MHIKRYEAPSLEEALARIKEELGPDALVLSTRRVRKDGGIFGWLGKPVVEVVAAMDRERPVRGSEPYGSRRSASPRYAGNGSGASGEGSSFVGGGEPHGARRSPLARYAGNGSGAADEESSFVGGSEPHGSRRSPAARYAGNGADRSGRELGASGADEKMAVAHPSWRELSMTSALLEPLEAELRALRRAVDGIEPAGGAALRHEIAELRRHVEWLGARSNGRKDAVVERLLAAGFGAQPAKLLAAVARERGEAHDLDPRAALLDVLAERLDARLLPPRDDTAEPIALFVGACGVGKTTSVAKLAGRAESGIGLVTTDVHRAGGAESLRALASSRSVPIATAVSADDVLARIDALRTRRVLVDTSGAGRGEPAALAELVRLREALGRRARVHLVVSATTKEEDLRAELRRFAPLAPDSLIVAKCDDTEALASLGNLLLDERTPPLAWLGTGRRVPEDLAVPEPRALAERMLGVAA